MHAIRLRQGLRLHSSDKLACSSWQALRSSRSIYLSGSTESTTNLPVQVDLLEKYRGLVALGHIKYDEEQVRVVMRLRRLHKELQEYAPPAHSANLLSRVNAGAANTVPWWQFTEEESAFDKSGRALVATKGLAEELESLSTPKGLLLTGPPGSGKSFLVDLWFDSVSTPYKVRKHYSQLVLEIYRGVWEETQRRMQAKHQAPQSHSVAPERGPWNKTIRDHIRTLAKSGSLPIRWSTTRTLPQFDASSQTTDPSIAFMVAKRLLLRHWLLVFDEAQLLDVSSANLLADVLSWYWRMGGVVVGTSNKVPDELYRNGVQRERLEPFVAGLKARCPVMILDGDKDWREVSSLSRPLERTWFTSEQRQKFEDALVELLPELQPNPTAKDFRVFGRTIRIPWASGSICKFTFSGLCNETLGPADYLTIASNFSVIVIVDIPVLRMSSKDQARRFISLIDALYESRCRIVCLAEAVPEKLFFPDEGSAGGLAGEKHDDVDSLLAESVSETQDIYRPNVSSYDAPRMREAPVAPRTPLSIDSLSIFSGEEEQFAFKRALSRLLEMTSADYNSADRWSPLPLDARKWEIDCSLSHSIHSAQSASTGDSAHPPTAAQQSDKSLAADANEFGEEASYYASSNTDFKRPVAPYLSPDHIWGVREDWGAKAKDWGKGAKARRRTRTDNDDRLQGGSSKV